jgi:4-carboxymuconolactone decarboxylase
MTDDNQRYQRGLAKLAEMDDQAAQRMMDSLADIAPDFARYVVEYPFGDIFSRPGLDLRTRELITVSALTAMGHAAPQLKAHIQLALKAGCSRREIIETIIQMSVYAGFPAALNGLSLAKEVFAQEPKAASGEFMEE